MNVISPEDINYLSQQSTGRLNMILSGMTSLMSDTDSKVSAMESQNWFLRMIKTVTGKNKLTQQEIQQNHDKLSAYMAEAVAELYNRNCIDEKVMISLGMQLNEIYAEQLQLKQMLGAFVSKLNQKIDSIDNFHMLVTEIEQGVYSDYRPIVSVCSILSQIDSRMLQDSRKLEILRRSLGNLLSYDEVSICDYLLDIMETPMENIGQIALELVTIRTNCFAELLLEVIENYHFLPDLKKKMMDKNLIIQDILDQHGINDKVALSAAEIYNDMLQSKIEAIVNRNVTDESLSLPSPAKAPDPNIESTASVNENSESFPCTAEPINPSSAPAASSAPSIEAEQKEEIHIRGKINLKNGDVKEFNQKIIHFNAPITGEGIIKFTGCTIYYAGISHSRDFFEKWIQAKEIYLTDCKVEGISYDEYAHFLNAQIIEITDCELLNCTNCLYGYSPYDEPGRIHLKDCTIINPGQSFLDGDYIDNILENCFLTYNAPPIFLDHKKRSLSAGNLIMNHCTLCSRPPKMTDDYWYEKFIETKKCNITNCLISDFNCFVSDQGYSEKGPLLFEWCVFQNCSNIVHTDHQKRTIVKKCQFNNCYETLIDITDGSSEITDCEFNNWHGSEPSERNAMYEAMKRIMPESILKFKKYDKCYHSVKKCTFNNAAAHYDFLISASILKNTDTYIVNMKDCSFNNCTTERSSGKLIKHYATYYNAFKKEKQVQVINSDNGKYSSEKVSYAVLETNYSGKKIGYTLIQDKNLPSIDKSVKPAPHADANFTETKHMKNETSLSASESKDLIYGAIYYYLTKDYNKMISLPLYTGKQLSEQLSAELVKLKQLSPMLFSDLKVYFHGTPKECVNALFEQAVSLLEAQSSVTEAMKSKIKSIEKYIAAENTLDSEKV